MISPTIGILAGMGPHSTGPFIDLVVAECVRRYGARHDIDFPRMMILSQPAPFYEDRAVDHDALERAITDGLRSLVAAGAEFLAIACNTAHIYYANLAAAVPVKLLNIVTESVASIPSGAQRIALIAARPTVEAEIFQDVLRAHGYVICDCDWQSDVDALLGLIRDEAESAALQSQWHSIVAKAQRARADVILVACLDVSGVLPANWTAICVVDAARCLAGAIVKEWLERRR